MRVLVGELISAIDVMVDEATRTEFAALQRTTAPTEQLEVAVFGEIQQLREMAQDVASAVAGLTARLPM